MAFKCKLQLLTFFLCLAIKPALAQTAFEVETVTELLSALNASTGGELILLSDGDYGQLDIHNRNYTSTVTVAPNAGQNSVQFSNIDFQNTSYIRLDGLTIIANAREGVGIFSGSHHIEVLNTEIHGLNQFSRANPVYTQVSTLYGINTGGNVHSILVENIDAHDFQSSAYLFTSISNSVIRENHCDWVASDCFKFAGADNILFENNFGAGHIYSSPTAHVDFVQAQGTMSNSTFRGNVAIMNVRGYQGLFFDDATFTNLIFENNLIYTASIRGISVSGDDSTGMVARYNTVLRPHGSQKASLILLPSGSVKEFNIESNNVAKNADRFSGTNIVAQWDDDDDIAHYSLYYENATFGPGASIQDFKPVAGSPAENTVGAFARINALLEGGSPSYPRRDSPYLVIPLLEGGVIVLPM